MKISPVALLRGMAVGIAFVPTTMVAVFDFTGFRLPFAAGDGAALVASAALALLLAVPYRKLWKRVGFWALLVAFVGIYWAVVVRVAEGLGGVRTDVLCGITGAVEVAVFAVIMARCYHQGPEMPSWLPPQ